MRTTVVIAMILVATVAALITGLTLLAGARNVIYETRQEEILTSFSRQADEVFSEISSDSPDDTWDFYAESFPGPTTIIDLTNGRHVGSLIPDQIPGLVAFDDARLSSERRYMRTTLDGREVFYVSMMRSDLRNDPTDVLGIVVAYPLTSEHAQVTSLMRTGITIAAIAIILSGIGAFILGTRLTRPLLQLQHTAQGIAENSVSAEPVPTSFSDIADVDAALRSSAKELSRTIEKLVQRDQESRQLVSDVAHELRTPLTSMMAVTEILEDYPNATYVEIRDTATILTTGTQRMASLVESLLELSRLDAGAARIRRSHQSLAATLTHAINTAGAIEATTVLPHTEISLFTDHRRVETIISNLLTNAMRYAEPPIEITIRHDKTMVYIDVRDNGPGVPTSDHQKIFQRFVMLDSSRTSGSGNGLGLAIAQDNARALGGDLIILPTDHGAHFRLSLPLDLNAESEEHPGEPLL